MGFEFGNFGIRKWLGNKDYINGDIIVDDWLVIIMERRSLFMLWGY